MGTSANRTEAAPRDRSMPSVPSNSVATPGDDYRSAFRNWERRATVRVRPKRTLADGQSADRDEVTGETFTYFPPELVPAVSHPLVREHTRSTTERILVQRLYQYLHFTTELE